MRGIGSFIGAGVVGLLLLTGGLSSCSTVDAGEVGLKNVYGQVGNEVLAPGLHFKNPITTSIETMSIQSKRKDGQTGVYTKDFQTATVTSAITYSLDPNAAPRMRRTVGNEWEARLISPVVESSIKSVFGQVNAIAAIENRQAMQNTIQDMIRKALSPRGIRVESFALTNIDYSDAFEKAVEDAQVATQNAVAARNHTVQVQEEAKQTEIRAQADAKAMQIKSQALSSNPGLTQYEAVHRWNGVLPQNIYGSAPIPFLNVNK
jgi:regulator of protease activity HflC (stomatin/prohibitin superfamily)